MHDSGEIEVPSPTDLLRLERSDSSGRTPGNPIAQMTPKQIEDLARSADVLRTAAHEENNVLMGLYQVNSASKAGLDIGPRLGLSAPYHYDLFSVDLETGNSQSLATGQSDTKAWLFDERGVAHVRIDTNLDSGRVAAFVRNDAGGAWHQAYAYDIGERGARGMSFDDLSPADPNIAYVLARTGSERIGAYEFDLRSGTLGRSLISGPSAGVDRFLRDPLTRRVIGVAYFESQAPLESFAEGKGEQYTVTSRPQADVPRLQIFDPEWQTLYGQIAAGFPGENAVITSIATNHKTLIAFVDGGEDRGGAYYFVDLAQGRSWKVGSRFNEPAGATIAAVQSLRFRGRDGLMIPAQLVVPGGRNGRRLPLIVLLEGDAEAGSLGFADWRAQVWAHSGYAVLQPQFRGPDGLGSTMTRRLSTPLIGDLHAAVAQLVERGVVDGQHVCFSTTVGARGAAHEEFGGASGQAGAPAQLSLCQAFAAY